MTKRPLEKWLSRQKWVKGKLAIKERERLEKQGQLRLFPPTGLPTEPVGLRQPAWEE
jgi:hypothetical protein